jgi:hypothetical protein
MIKVSTCMYYLRIVPDHHPRVQHFIYVLVTAILGLGLVEAYLWTFNCSPVKANFIYNLPNFNCPAEDRAHWIWIVLSVTFDVAMLLIPWFILREAGLPKGEKRVLRAVFAANLLGTMAW